MARKRTKQGTPLQWIIVGIAGLALFCVACGVIAMLFGETEEQVAQAPTAQPSTNTPRPEPTRTLAPAPTAEPTPEPEPTAEPTPEPEPTATPETVAIPPQVVPPEPTQPPLPPTSAPDRQAAQVVDVVDGDTLKVQIDGQQETLRLIGIDTPESVHPRQPVQCFGREASAKTQELAADQVVQLEADPTQDDVDRYGRLLRYVYVPSGQMLNQELIAQGYAFEYTYNVPYLYQAEFQQAEQDARTNQRGLWAPATCNGELRPADEPAPTPTQPPVVQEEQPAGNCHPAYANVCIPPPPPDLNCPDIRADYGCGIEVISWPDPHEIDRDQDGIGCEC